MRSKEEINQEKKIQLEKIIEELEKRLRAKRKEQKKIKEAEKWQVKSEFMGNFEKFILESGLTLNYEILLGKLKEWKNKADLLNGIKSCWKNEISEEDFKNQVLDLIGDAKSNQGAYLELKIQKAGFF